MATFNLKRFCRPDGLSRIEPGHLLRLLRPYQAYFQRRGASLPEPDAVGTWNLPALLAVLLTPDGDTPQDLVDALYYIHEMSTPQAMDLLLAELDVEGCESTWLGDFSPADVAVKAWLDDPEMLQRKHAELHLRVFRSFMFFRSWRRPLPAFAPPSPERLAAMERSLDERFSRKNRGRGAKVFVHPQRDGATWFVVRHGDPYRREGALRGGQPASVAYRPARFDVAAYDPAAGELRLHARQPWELALYRQQFGLCLFGRMDFFSDGPKYSLRPLHEKGAASLHCAGVPGVRWVALKEVHLLWGGRHKEVEIHRADDVFAALRLRNINEIPRKAELVEATFAVRFDDSADPRRVTIRPPNTAVYTREEDAPAADRRLAAQGFIDDRESEDDQADPPLLASA